MNDESLDEIGAAEDAPLTRDHVSATKLRRSESKSLTSASPARIVITATFTADLLRSPLQFWMEALGIAADMALAPYSQVMQELLSPGSLVSQNGAGFNVLLIRLEDWIRDRRSASINENVRHIDRVANELVEAVGVARSRTSASIIVFFCPSLSSLPEPYAKSLHDVQTRLILELQEFADVNCFMHEDIVRRYPVARYEDTRTDRIGHVPYAAGYFVAIATVLARQIAAVLKPRYKVIAIDCDNTLWKGVCGEDGAAGVEVTPAHREFQRMLVRQHDSGMLLCLCSKNNAGDVQAVFRSHPGMPLREEHMVCTRLNWNSKSSNLVALSQELDLSLDSFIFIDDSPLECAEVRAHCPSVLVLQFPQTGEEVRHFLEHVWAFDHAKVTDEARQRTTQYRQNRARKAALEESDNIDHFLATLELKVDVSPMKEVHLARVAELIQRTNQFNLTTRRRSRSEIDSLWRSGEMQCLIVQVRDRFGEYGLVGTVFFRQFPSAIDVDTFLLSCRVLGRGVEHRVINHLGRVARQEGRANVVLRYRPTPRNTPASKFLKSFIGGLPETSEDAGGQGSERVFTVPAEIAESLSNASAVSTEMVPETQSSIVENSSNSRGSIQWHETAYRLSRIGDVVDEMQRRMPVFAQERGPFIAPRTPTEAAVAEAWAKVLRRPHIGAQDNFFDVGGDSMRAVQVIAEIESALGAQLSIYDFFDKPTVEAVAAKLVDSQGAALPDAASPAAMERPSITPKMFSLVALSQAELDALVQTVPGGAPNLQDIYPLCPLQDGLLFHHLVSAGRDTYIISILFELQDHAQASALFDALQRVIDRHDILRTAMVWEQVSRPLQVVYRHATLPVEELALDWECDPVQQLMNYVRQAPETMDLRKAPLLRLHVAADPHSARGYALLQVHHLICDHESLRVLVDEAMACLRGRVEELHPPAAYRDYVTWSTSQATTHDAEGFFRRMLAEVEEPAAPFGVMDVYGDGSNIEEATRVLDLGLSRRVRGLARSFGVTAARLFHVVWGLVVAHTSGRDDVVYGTVLSAARPKSAQEQSALGMFINTLPLRLQLQDATVDDLVAQTHRRLLELWEHGQTSLTTARRCSGITGKAPLFTALLNYRYSIPTHDSEHEAETGIRVAARGDPWTNYPVALTVDDSGQDFLLTIRTDHRIDPRRMIGYVHAAMESLVEALQETPQRPALSLSIVPESEWRELVEEFNGIQKSVPQDKLIHELFQEQVERTPDAVAVVYEGQLLTYSELNGKANQLARHLRTKGVGPDQLVALCIQRSVEMLVGVLGVLKAGGAYVPLDPTNPKERLEHLLADAKPGVLLTQERLRDVLSQAAAEVIALDSDWGAIDKQGKENLDPKTLELKPRHLAYVIYTSGSTGKPKGVMVEHRNVVNYAVHALRQFDVPSGDGSLVCSSISFDLMLTGLYPVLLCGKTVRLCREDQGLPALADELLQCRNLAPLKLTPSHLALLEHPLRNGQLDGRVRVLVLGGEPLHARAVQLWRKHAPGTRIFNHYGPTEATVGCVVYEIVDPVVSTVPIGRPISNARIYILDAQRQVVPIGAVGEIYIGGAGIARGYLRRPDLTELSFIRDPFSDDPQARMYKTGDLGRWRADGTIEYLGRNDHQVKIRGFRIELAEIEAQLVRHERVKDAAVIVREDIPGERRLVAYVTQREQGGVSVESLRNHVRTALPDYMTPSGFVILDRLPLTPNGKLDQQALPAPDLGSYAGRQYQAPKGEVEEILAGIWQSLLGVERVGRNDNFFELGGHSLLIVQMKEHLRRAGLSVEVRRIFESQTLAELASAMTADARLPEVPANLIPPGCEAITPEMLPLVQLGHEHIDYIVRSVPGGAANIQDVYPLAPLQEGLLFHHLLGERGGDAYLVPIMLSASSRERVYDLIAALQSVINRHDILRTAVLWEHLPQPVQVVYRQASLPVEELPFDRTREPLEQIREWIKLERQRLDIRCAPLMRLQIAAGQGGEWHVLLQTHHVTSDHVAWEVVISEIVAHMKGRAQVLPESAPYRNHVAQALAHARKHDSEAFFRDRLGDLDQPTAPFGLLDVYGDGSLLEEAREDLPTELARRIRARARRSGVSAATLFHAAWSLVVARTSGRDDVVFGSVLLGRLQGTADAQRTLGMFINTLPLRLRLKGLTATELVGRTYAELVELFGHEQASLAVAQRCSGISGAAPLFTTLFNYRHSALDTDAELASVPGIRVLAGARRTNYPITFSVDDLGDAFRLVALTDARIDPRRVASYMRTALYSLVDALEHASEALALRLPILPEDERRQVAESFNATKAAYPGQKLVHELFEEQVDRTPDAVAAVHEGQSFTYSELNRRANQLARYLRREGVQPGEYIPIVMPRSLQMLIAQLAVLKCGGAYVPVDPTMPSDRQQFMLRDCAARRAVVDQGSCAGLQQESMQWIDCASVDSTLVNVPDGNLKLQVTTPAPAYVMYTSGSTGSPKGVVVPHHAVNRLVLNTNYVRIDSKDCIAHCSNPAFDASTFEIWGGLLNGARVLVLSQSDVLDARQFVQEIKRQRVTVLWLTAGLFAQYTDVLVPVLGQLRYLLTGGEVVDPAMIRRVLRNNPPLSMLNAYGPTECTTFSTTCRIDALDDDTKSIPIGRPISNARIYILNGNLESVPIGVTGEIYIGGAGIALGYLNRPELTAERFIADPFGGDSQSRLYKSGDLGRWRADGNVEFVGRNDHQVKLRGFRIELGEIEAQLVRHPQVKEAVVVACEDVPGEKRLLAYVVPDREAAQVAVADSAPDKLRHEIVGEWETLYEEIYGAPSQAGPTFVGWESSYTGQPIPETEMQEWLTCTVERIKALHPNKVLEIGCGVGLILQHVAPQCPMYVGTDFSASALRQLRHWMSVREDLRHVELLHRSATELEDLQSGCFDVVILNSVVQYFPDIKYLLTVLHHAVRLLSPGGKIFMGDIRHLGSLRTFHSAVQLAKAAATITAGQLRRRIDRAVAQDKELVIDPEFFQVLPGRLFGVSAAEVLLKRGRSSNELTRYRYDVVLHTGGDIEAHPIYESLDWHTTVGSEAKLEEALAERRWSAVRVHSIPNLRLARDAAAQRLIETSDEGVASSSIRRQVKEMQSDAMDPERLWELAQAHNYRVTVSPNEQGCCEIELLDSLRAHQVQPPTLQSGDAAKPWSAYANDPLESGLRQQLIPHLREYLKERLPEYMIPAAWMLLRQLPLTPNGKVDRRSLPALQGRPEELGEYVAPSTEVERILADIWAQLLRVDQVGVQDNFFDLGGHSLLALKVLTKINQSFGSSLKVTDAYKSPTIRKLAERISGAATEDELVDLSQEAVLPEEILARHGRTSASAKAVMLTGGTGFVGRFLLAQLLQETDAKIYCLVRASSQHQASLRLRTNLAKWDLWRDEFEPRIVGIPADLRVPRLGLDDHIYRALSQEIESIFHCGTSMNHLETYTMAKQANVGSALELLRFATEENTKTINYISTLGIFSSSTTDAARVVNEESQIDHEKHWNSRGYVASKWVGEKIFLTANERGIPCNIFRLGLVCADTQQGRYDELQREYRVIKSCILSGCGIENYRYEWAPTPVDYVARAVVFLANHHRDGRGVFHISSSDHGTGGVFERCNQIADTSLRLMTFYDWICEMKRLHHEGASLPIVPLIEYAFSMDEQTFREHQRRAQRASTRIDCTRTHQELEQAGIWAPVLSDDVLRMCLETMCASDEELREWSERKRNLTLTERDVQSDVQSMAGPR